MSTPTPSAIPPGGWRRSVSGAFTERLGLKLIALLLAMLLWILAGVRQMRELPLRAPSRGDSIISRPASRPSQ